MGRTWTDYLVGAMIAVGVIAGGIFWLAAAVVAFHFIEKYW